MKRFSLRSLHEALEGLKHLRQVYQATAECFPHVKCISSDDFVHVLWDSGFSKATKDLGYSPSHFSKSIISDTQPLFWVWKTLPSTLQDIPTDYCTRLYDQYLPSRSHDLLVDHDWFFAWNQQVLEYQTILQWVYRAYRACGANHECNDPNKSANPPSCTSPTRKNLASKVFLVVPVCLKQVRVKLGKSSARWVLEKHSCRKKIVVDCAKPPTSMHAKAPYTQLQQLCSSL